MDQFYTIERVDMAMKDTRCDCPVRVHYVAGTGWVDRCANKGTTFVMALVYTSGLGYRLVPVYMCTRHKGLYTKGRRGLPYVGSWSYDGVSRRGTRTDFGDEEFDGVIINGKKPKAGVY